MPTNVIVPLDRSHVAECAVPYARAIARQTGVPLTLVTVVEPSASLPDPPAEGDLPPIEERPAAPSERQYSASMPVGFNPGHPGMSEDDFEEATSALKEAEQYLDYVGDSIDDVRVEKMVIYGKPVSEIVKLGKEQTGHQGAMPLIVMASHGRSGLGRVLLGSVALSVAEQSVCPMLVVRAIKTRPPSIDEIDLNRVLIALDGSGFSEAVIEPVHQIFGREGSRLHFLRVVEEDRHPFTGRSEARDGDGRSQRDVAEQYLSNLTDRFKTRGFSVDWDVMEGQPAERINAMARDIDASVIALATHGHSGLKRLAIGSVAEEVLNKADRPLLLVRPGDSA
jgi:nucleotide-binding universal stress UspA family protein